MIRATPAGLGRRGRSGKDGARQAGLGRAKDPQPTKAWPPGSHKANSSAVIQNCILEGHALSIVFLEQVSAASRRLPTGARSCCST
jgi:hypothetical protein